MEKGRLTEFQIIVNKKSGKNAWPIDIVKKKWIKTRREKFGLIDRVPKNVQQKI